MNMYLAAARSMTSNRELPNSIKPTRNIKLSSLDASNEVLCKLLTTLLEDPGTPEFLNMSKNKIVRLAPEAEGVIAKLVNLRNLDVSFNELDDQGAEDLVNTIIGLDKLTKLNLCGNNIRSIAISPTGFKHLKVLDISFNELGGSGTEYIANLLKSNSTITKLELAHNNIMDNGICKISKALETNQSLQVLGLSYNLVTADGFQILIKAITLHPAMTGIEFSFNHVSLIELIGVLSQSSASISTKSITFDNHSLGKLQPAQLPPPIKINTYSVITCTREKRDQLYHAEYKSEKNKQCDHTYDTSTEVDQANLNVDDSLELLGVNDGWD